ncbi:ParB/RepB/Spo0J family partition protein [Nocardioides jensenii]|uniref:ParB/RepB/Spo0J family partition protein n=1 Tax=Nocardioides jensenii TaxID=1843 RepID=UPI0008356047|nr:ParB/RepB/Spo0J family partition protein [Nocardioides jensenii]
MTTFAIVPIDQVAPHPRNIRRSAVADEELVSSVLEAGIHEPVLLGPEDADGVRFLIAGNRRYDAAVKAGLTSLPAMLRDDLDTEAKQSRSC